MGAKEQYEARKAQHEARQKRNAEHGNEHSWWFNQPAAIDRFTGWLVVWTALLFVATVVIAAATIVNVIYVGGQLAEMKSSGAQTDQLIITNANLAQAAKDQAAAALAQSKAAQLIAEDSRLTIVPSFQAQTTSGRVLSPNQLARFEIFINNSGFARANQYVAWVKAEVREFPLIGTITTTIPSGILPTSVGKDSAAPELYAITSAPVTSEELAAINQGDKAVYIFGEAAYVDPYGNPGKYSIRFIGRGAQLDFTAGDFPVTENPN